MAKRDYYSANRFYRSRVLSLLLASTTLPFVAGCSLFPSSFGAVGASPSELRDIATGGADLSPRNFSQGRFLESGSIIISRRLPSEGEINSTLEGHAFNLNLPPTDPSILPVGDGTPLFAPLLGYIPPVAGFLAAENEAWLEVNRETRLLAVYKGETLIKQIQGEGTVPLEPGNYALQYKQTKPVWYASDEYFRRRHLTVPPGDDHLRYRRGALGPFALYPNDAFPIHSAPVWSDDVGGLRVPQSELREVYYLLPVGSTVVVR